MYKPRSKRSHRSRGSMENYSSTNSIEGTKITSMGKYSAYFNLEEQKQSKGNKQNVVQSFADMFFQNQKVFKNALIKFKGDNNCYMDKKSAKHMRKSSKRRKKLVKSESKQKIILKIPTMISVCMDKPIIQLSNSDHSSKSSERIKDYQVKRQNKRYPKSRRKISKISQIPQKPSRQQLKVKESNVNSSVIMPSQNTQKPLIKNSKNRKIIRRNNPLIECALTHLQKSKEYQTLDISKDSIKDPNLELEKPCLRVDQKTNAINNFDLKKNSISIDQRRKTKSAVKNLIYCSTVQSIGRKYSNSSVGKPLDNSGQKKSISMLDHNLDPYKNLPQIQSKKLQNKGIIVKAISSDNSKEEKKEDKKDILKRKSTKNNENGRKIHGDRSLVMNKDIQGLRRRMKTIQNSSSSIRKKPNKAHLGRKSTINQPDNSNFGTYSVVDLLQRPAIAGEQLPQKPNRSISGRKNRRNAMLRHQKKPVHSFVLRKEVIGKKLQISENFD